MGACNFPPGITDLAGESNLTIVLMHGFRASVQNKFQAFRFQRSQQFRCDFWILARNNLRPLMNDGDAAAITAEHLPKFEANVTATQNQQIFGNHGELHD